MESGQVFAHLTHGDQPVLRLQVMGSGVVVGELSIYLDIPATASVFTTQIAFQRSNNPGPCYLEYPV